MMSLAGPMDEVSSYVRLDLPSYGKAAPKIVPLIFESHDGRALVLPAPPRMQRRSAAAPMTNLDRGLPHHLWILRAYTLLLIDPLLVLIDPLLEVQ